MPVDNRFEKVAGFDLTHCPWFAQSSFFCWKLHIYIFNDAVDNRLLSKPYQLTTLEIGHSLSESLVTY